MLLQCYTSLNQGDPLHVHSMVDDEKLRYALAFPYSLGYRCAGPLDHPVRRHGMHLIVVVLKPKLVRWYVLDIRLLL